MMEYSLFSHGVKLLDNYAQKFFWTLIHINTKINVKISDKYKPKT